VDVIGSLTDEQARAEYLRAVEGEPIIEDDPILPVEEEVAAARAREAREAELANAGFEGHAGRPGQRGGSVPRGDKGQDEPEKITHAEKQALALASYKPSTAEKRRVSEKYEAEVARAVKGVNLSDNEPPDVVKGKNAVEVKTIVEGKNPKITMHGESLARKVKYGRVNKVTWHTVAVDARGEQPVYYYKQGVGSFRLKNMEPVTLEELGRRIK
jgi:hypothetical protein